MVSFYPGPSRVRDEIPEYVKDAYKAGILSVNHRSDEFMNISERAIGLLKSKLAVPDDYTVFYTTSATECWEIIAQSVSQDASYHVYNGAFGQKWFDYTRRILSTAKRHTFGHNDLVEPKKLRPGKQDGVICITQNETSNGTQVSNDIIGSIREQYPQHLVAVDATSSMAGITLDFGNADIWFASVQKCFGLPAGLGLMACSPRAIERVRMIGEKDHYNSLTFMADMMEKWQTPFTPNVLNIYLLYRVMEASKPIRDIHAKTVERYHAWAGFFREKKSLRHFIENEEARSFTVIPVEAEETLISSIKSRAKKKGFLLGEGYGDLKPSTFRIANFPAIRKKEIKALMKFLNDYS